MGIKFANGAFATLASGINSSATSITLTSGQGARFPSLSGGDYFFATLIDTSNNLEIVKCTARSTDVLTVTRGQESTTARSFSAGDRIELRITAQGMVDNLLATDIDDILPSQTGNSGKYLTTNGSASSWGIVDLTNLSASNLTSGTISTARMYSGAVLKYTNYTNTTRYTPSSAATSTIYNFTYTKAGSTDVGLVISANMQIWNDNNGGTYMFVDIDGTKYYTGVHDDNASSGGPGVVNVGLYVTGLASGNRTIGIGWSTADGASNLPFTVVHPNTSDDARNRQQGSSWHIWEVKA
jgi:hypothetical protein